MRVTIVHNPASGDASPSRESLLGIFAAAGDEVVRYVTSDSDWRMALEEPADLVVAVGGDGTVGPVLAAMAGGDRKVAILPTGTANNIAATLGIGGDARELVRRWANGRYAPFDVWELASGATTAHMVEAMGGGFFASCIERDHEIDPPTFLLGGPMDRAMHLARERLADEPARRWGVVLDGEDHSGSYIGVEVMNGPFVGPNIELAPGAEPGDGLLDVVLIEAADRERLNTRLDPRSSGQKSGGDAPTIVRVREVRLSPPVGVALHRDGVSWSRGQAGGDDVDIRHAGSATVYAPSA